MCGIVGCIGNNIGDRLTASLRLLQHRGYDSWGMAYYDLYKDQIAFIKELGRVPEDARFEDCGLTIGIGHTRWPTHGKPSIDNAHPIKVNDDIYLIHNGTINNIDSLCDRYDTLYDETKTDTQLLAIILNKDFRVLEYIDGDNICLLLFENEIHFRVTGNKVLYWNHNTIASECIYDDMIICEELSLDGGGGGNNRWFQWEGEISDSQDTVEVEHDYPHNMLKEIYDQRNLLENKETVPLLQPKRKYIFTGSGSSYHAALFGHILCQNELNMGSQVEYASEFYDKAGNPPYDDGKHTLIAITQSGETKDTADVIFNFEGQVIPVTNNPKSLISERYGGISLNIGKEFGVAATKTFTATCIALWRSIDPEWKYQILDIDGAWLENYIKDCDQKITNLYEDYIDIERFLFLGSGLDYPIALEGALKLKEIACVPAEGMPSAEIKHGPIALVNNRTLSVFIVNNPSEEKRQRIYNNIREIHSRDGKILVFTKFNDFTIEKFAKRCIIEVPETDSPLDSILATIPLQLFAYRIAVAKGLNPDYPFNLAKTITV